MAEKRGKMPRPEAVTNLLSAVFHGTPTERRLKEGRIWLVWESAVGRQISERAAPVAFRDGTLTVAVTSAPWMQQLNFLKKGMMEKINALVGEELVKDIYLKAGKAQQGKPEPTRETRRKRGLSSTDIMKIEEKTGPVADPDLRQALQDLLAKHLENSQP